MACLSFTLGPGCGTKGQLLPMPSILGQERSSCSMLPHALSVPRKDWFKAKAPKLFYLDSLTIWTKKILGLGCSFCSRPSLCRMGGFCKTAAQEWAKRNIHKNWLKLHFPELLLSNQESIMVPAVQSHHTESASTLPTLPTAHASVPLHIHFTLGHWFSMFAVPFKIPHSSSPSLTSFRRLN